MSRIRQKNAKISHFDKLRFFFEKTYLLFQKDPNFGEILRFELSPIRWQICYNLVNNKLSQSETWTNFFFSVNAICRHWLNKMHPFEWMSFFSYVIIWRKKLICILIYQERSSSSSSSLPSSPFWTKCRNPLSNIFGSVGFD